MAASSLSMAAAAVAATATSYISSSPLHKKISNLSFPLSSTNFQHKPLYLKFPKLALISRSSPYRALSAAFDELSVAEDRTLAENEDEEFDDDEFDEEEEEEEEEEEVIRSIGVGRLYVGNLPYAITSTQLTEIFGEAGRVNSVEIVYDRVTDRSRGFAFVTMGSVDDAKEAIRMYDGAQVGGRTVKVNFPEVPKGGEREIMGPKIRNSYRGFLDTPHKIYAGNLSWNVTSEGLKNVFEDQPGFLSAKVIYERDTGKSRGFGFVSFSTAEEVQSALNALNGLDVEGRPLRLNLASERAPPAPPPPAVERNTENSLEERRDATPNGFS